MSDYDTIEKIIADLHPWLPKAISIQFAQRLRSLRQVPNGWVLVPREPTPEMVAVAVLALHETASLGLRNADAARNAWIAMVEETCRTHKAVPSGDDEVRVQNFYSRAMRELVEEGERATQTTILARAEQLHKAFLANPAPPTSGPETLACKKCGEPWPDYLLTQGGCIKCRKSEPTPAQAVAVNGEADAFEAWAVSQRYDMQTHPLHWLFLNQETYAARQGWKAGLAYADSLAQAGAELPELPEPVGYMERNAWGPKPDYYTADQMRAYAELARRGGSDDVSELRKVAKRNLRSLITRSNDSEKELMLKCLEELS